jgi:hypothetical protein
MTNLPPDFDELVGDDVEGAQRDRLRRVHDLLVAAGPPPEPSARTAPETGVVVPFRRRRRRGVLLGLAAALAVAAIFTLGLVVATGDDPSAERVVAMTGPSGASASLEIFELDDAGNWPMLIDVQGLPPREGKLFELWLTADGVPTAFCGSFLTDDEGRAVVPLNAPWRIDDFDGWVVVEAGSTRPLLST